MILSGALRVYECERAMYGGSESSERCNKRQKKKLRMPKLPLNMALCVCTTPCSLVVSCQFVSYLFQDLQIMTFSC